MNLDVIILTDKRYLEDSKDAYKHNVFFEDQLVENALVRLGIKTSRKAWDDKSVNWSKTKAILFRSTWDYFDRFEEFSNWLSLVSSQTKLINSEGLIRWNLDKHYLKDLSNKGIHIPTTEFIEKGSQTSLKALHSKLNWQDTVLKPCISGAARHTYRLNAANIASYEGVFKQLIEQESMMLQPFQKNIVSQGELSMMVFKGEYTHAILKKAKKGDFRVQDDFGGTVQTHTPSHKEILFSESAVLACPELPIYARVDIFYDNNDQLALSELELIEPELWFREFPEAANHLAKSIKGSL